MRYDSPAQRLRVPETAARPVAHRQGLSRRATTRRPHRAFAVTGAHPAGARVPVRPTPCRPAPSSGGHCDHAQAHPHVAATTPAQPVRVGLPPVTQRQHAGRVARRAGAEHHGATTPQEPSLSDTGRGAKHQRAPLSQSHIILRLSPSTSVLHTACDCSLDASSHIQFRPAPVPHSRFEAKRRKPAANSRETCRELPVPDADVIPLHAPRDCSPTPTRRKPNGTSGANLP